MGSTSLLPNKLNDIIWAIADHERQSVDRAADRCVEAITRGGRVVAFGAGHAYAFAAELHSRAGGLAAFVAINLDDLRRNPRHRRCELSDSGPERDGANGPALLVEHAVRPPDLLLIASNSGRNSASIEMAIRARRLGVGVVAVVSRRHAAAVRSRHPSGQKLIDVADIVIDNHCPAGDALLTIDDGAHICAGSTVAFATIAQLLNESVYRRLRATGRDRVTAVRSANLDAPGCPRDG